MRAIFVYGTLRMGQGNARIWQDAVLGAVVGAKANGQMFHAYGNHGYPGVNFDGPGEVTGDVVYVDEGYESVEDVDRMEIGAGYDLRAIEVRMPDGTTEWVDAYHMEHPLGAPIPSGNWLDRSLQGA